MSTLLKTLVVAALTAAPVATFPAIAQHAAHEAAQAAPAPKLKAAMRSLWHGHILHTRAYANAVHANNPADAKKAADAVVANAKQISDAVASFYGTPAGEQLLTLLAGHWGAVKQLTDARASKDEASATAAMTNMTNNAGAIAEFLAGANPNLPEPDVRGLLVGHGAHHAQQIQQVMAGDRQGEANTWVAMRKHMDTIADALAAAIAKQFPDKAA